MNLLRKIQYSQYWNIGFCKQTPDELIRERALRPVQWLKHSYRDRWFADPFILKVTESEIVVFVEECPVDNPKGIICELVIDRNSMRLKERYVMLKKDTHLSYPAIIRHEGRVYVYPENGASGELNIYEYDEANHCLINPVCILKEAVADATILKHNGRFYMSATKFPDTQEKAYLYDSPSLFKTFIQSSEGAYEVLRSFSRQGGDWFEASGRLFRPAQDCVERYGAAISVMGVDAISSSVVEKEAFHIKPEGGKYKLGLHTLNFLDGMCVVDGYGYYMPLLGEMYYKSGLRRLFRR